MRHIDLIVVHCTATRAGRDFTVSQIRHFHTAGNGWDDIGYHFVVYRDGTVHPGRPLERAGAHTRNHNANSIGVAYVGGLTADGKAAADTRTPQQKEALTALLTSLRARFPQAVIRGHHDLNPGKECPCFNATAEYANL